MICLTEIKKTNKIKNILVLFFLLSVLLSVVVKGRAGFKGDNGRGTLTVCNGEISE